jgi:hypothetical protein
MILRAAVSQQKGLDFEPCGLIGSGGSLEFSSSVKNALQVIRPCRESETGWTPDAPVALPGNQSSLVLNEHGPALKVFWISEGTGIGREASATAACQAGGCSGKRLMTKKTEPEGAGTGLNAGPLLSVRN